MYDYVHQRDMNRHVTDRGRLFRQAFAHLRPGGYYEIQELDIPWELYKSFLVEDSALLRWGRHLEEAALRLGRQFNINRFVHEELIQVGFVEVTREVYKVSTTARQLHLPVASVCLSRPRRYRWERGRKTRL